MKPSTEELTWTQVVALGKELNNDSLRALRAEVQAQSENLGVSRAEWLPSLDLQVTQGQETSDEFKGETAKSRDGYLVLSQNLFRGFATVGKQSESEAKLNRAQAKLELEEISVRARARQEFFQAWHLQKKSTYFKDLSDRLQKNLQLVRLKYDSGLEGKWAVDLLDVQKKSADLEWQSSQLEFIESLHRLSELLGTSLSRRQISLSPEDFLKESPALNKPISDEKLLSHPQSQLMRASVKESEALVTQARSSFLPTLSLDYRRGFTHTDLPPLAESRYNKEQVQLTLTWNLFAGGATRSSVDSAHQTLIASQQYRQNSLAQLKLDLEKESRQFQLLQARYLNKAEERRILKIRSETVTSQYQNGTRKYADWEVAQTKLAEVEGDFLDIESALLKQRAELERVAGVRWED